MARGHKCFSSFAQGADSLAEKGCAHLYFPLFGEKRFSVLAHMCDDGRGAIKAGRMASDRFGQSIPPPLSKGEGCCQDTFLASSPLTYAPPSHTGFYLWEEKSGGDEGWSDIYFRFFDRPPPSLSATKRRGKGECCPCFFSFFGDGFSGPL